MIRRRMNSAKSTEESGFFTIWLVVLTMMILGMAGISIDVWHGFAERRELAAITDSATIAGAAQIDLATFKTDGTVKLDPVAAHDAAALYLQEQANEAGITFTSAPQIDVTADQITVTASTEIELTLMKIFAPNTTLPITTHSAAAPQAAA